MKIVINTCFGGFGLSDLAEKRYADITGGNAFDRGYEARNDEALVRVVEELGEAAGDKYAALKVVEIPDGVKWEIEDYDGRETIHEQHRSWS